MGTPRYDPGDPTQGKWGGGVGFTKNSEFGVQISKSDSLAGYNPEKSPVATSLNLVSLFINQR